MSAAHARIIPEKTTNSVPRKTHTPSVPVPFCCSIVLNCPYNAPVRCPPHSSNRQVQAPTARLSPGRGPAFVQSSPWAGATTPSEPFPLGTSSPRSGRLWKSYASHVTTGVTSKFSVSGGDCVFHSSPVAGHGFSPATFPKNAAQVKYTIGSRYPTAKIDAPAVDITL